jgi:hypothetical protein
MMTSLLMVQMIALSGSHPVTGLPVRQAAAKLGTRRWTRGKARGKAPELANMAGEEERRK